MHRNRYHNFYEGSQDITLSPKFLTLNFFSNHGNKRSYSDFMPAFYTHLPTQSRTEVSFISEQSTLCHSGATLVIAMTIPNWSFPHSA